MSGKTGDDTRQNATTQSGRGIKNYYSVETGKNLSRRERENRPANEDKIRGLPVIAISQDGAELLQRVEPDLFRMSISRGWLVVV